MNHANHFFKCVLMLLGPVLVLNCASVKVKTGFDASTVFPEFKTFRWGEFVKEGDASKSLRNPKFAEKVKQEIVANLAAKNIKLTDQGEADLVVSFKILRQNHTAVAVTEVPTMYEDHSYYMSRPYAYYYIEGSLVVDMALPSNMEQIIWHGVAKADLDLDVKPEVVNQKIEIAVEKLFKEFPPHS